MCPHVHSSRQLLVNSEQQLPFELHMLEVALGEVCRYLVQQVRWWWGEGAQLWDGVAGELLSRLQAHQWRGALLPKSGCGKICVVVLCCRAWTAKRAQGYNACCLFWVLRWIKVSQQGCPHSMHLRLPTGGTWKR